ncbi:MAG TPA: sporulation protein YunB [Candidatus Scatovicinus merdipullorum]|nr:sporulation protein YunB [Candidatus Scatovicinus merdipullorum]
MRIRRKRRRKTSVFKRVLILLVLLFVASFLFLELQVRPMIFNLTEIKAQALATEAINKAVEAQQLESDFTYEDLVDVQYSSSNAVQSISANTVNINALKAAYSLSAQEEIDQLRHREIKFYTGDLSGMDLLRGLGPVIKVRLNFSSSIETSVTSQFVSAGINQTQHIIELEIKAEIYLTSDGTIPNVEVVTNVPVAETVIVGTTPTLYASRFMS